MVNATNLSARPCEHVATIIPDMIARITPINTFLTMAFMLLIFLKIDTGINVNLNSKIGTMINNVIKS